MKAIEFRILNMALLLLLLCIVYLNLTAKPIDQIEASKTTSFVQANTHTHLKSN